MTNWKRNTALFLSGQALSMFGSMLTQYAIMWDVTLQTQSGIAMTLYVVLGVLPISFMSPIGGVWADRYNRKAVICLSDGGIALITLLTAIVLMLESQHTEQALSRTTLLIACATLRAFGQGVHSPAISAFIPQITPAKHLNKINGINTGIQSGVSIVSPMAAGALMMFMPLSAMFFIDVITAIIGIGILWWLVKVPASTAQVVTDVKRNHRQDFRDGLRYIRSHPFILQLILIATVFFFAMAPIAYLMPLQVVRNFGNEVWRLSTIEIVWSAGMVIGGLAVGFWGGFRNKMHSMSLSCFLTGIAGMALGLINTFTVYAVVVGLMGLISPLFSTPMMTLSQTRIDTEYMGRVFGIFGMVWSLMMPVGMLIFGPLADVISIDYLMIGSGAAIMLLCIPYVMSKTLREAGRER
ncbi:MAG: MFS transporter [Mediterranea sp.]|jgi:DHA3 family macrolide efflux protein-like MFS transporter|nr:MFS transporter [Mediterranea sp.]